MALTFTDTNSIDWYRTPIDPALLAELNQRSNFRGWVQTLAHLGFFFTTAALAYFVSTLITAQTWYWSAPLLIVCLFIHGTMGPFMGLIAIHELQHRTVFRTRWLNELFEKVYAFISWSDYIWYQESHARHHRATCHHNHDGEVYLPVRFSLKNKRFWLGILAIDPKGAWQRLTNVWHNARGNVRGDWNNHVLPESDTRLRRRHRNWARFLITGHTLLALLFIASGYWFLIAVFTFGTFYCSWLGFLCGVIQHYGLNSDVPDFRMNTRTFTCSWLPAFYYWNMQYHLEHHMYPAVPFHNLPRLRAALSHDLPVAPHGLRATWREILALRNNILTQQDFVYVPTMPDGAFPLPAEFTRRGTG